MRVEVRPVSRLRGTDRLNLTEPLAPVFDALTASTLDLSRVSVVLDWIQYRASFRGVADLRPVLASAPRGADGERGIELAIDLRRSRDADLGALVSALLADHASARSPARLALEPWVAGTASCIWRFNALFWQALSLWEQAVGRGYEQALPGGQSEARNAEAVRELILELFKTWDDLDARGALPAELYVVELGVGTGSQALTWLDELAALSSVHSRDYYRRLHYLMGDYSPHVLGRARRAVEHHAEHVTTLVVDATHPTASLSFLRGKAFLVYISNVYDNLPTDEVAMIGGRAYQVQVRAFLPGHEARRIGRRAGVPAKELPGLVEKLLRLGPELLCDVLPRHFGEPGRAVEFWREVWGALRLQERYVPMEGLDLYQIGPDLTGETLRPLLESHGDVRMHVNNGALSSFAETLPLLHPYGRLQCHDLFVTEVHEYHSGFFGPGKYDGSVVNWVNGPLLRHVAGRLGFDAVITPFARQPSAAVKTLAAAVRE
jgi:hypothetical protein